MSRFLLDANIAFEAVDVLRTEFGIDVEHVRSRGMSRFLDEEIAHVARAEGLVVISNDHDFGALWHRSDADLFGVVMLRLKDQTVEGVVSALRQLFGQDAPSIDFGRTLIVVRDASFRVVPRS